MKLYSKEANESIFKELWQIDKKGTWVPVDVSQLSKNQYKKIVRTFMFLSEKYDAKGNFEKLKARLVAMGNLVDKEDITMDTSAATVSNISIFTCSALAAMEDREVMIVDIGGAYLHAFIPDDTEIFVRLDKINAEILCQIRPEYKKFFIK